MASTVYHNNIITVNTMKNLINFLSNSSSSNFSVVFSPKRFIERITQIREAPGTPEGYEAVDLISYEEGSYKQKNRLDEATRRQMERWLSETEREAFRAADI